MALQLKRTLAKPTANGNVQRRCKNRDQLLPLALHGPRTMVRVMLKNQLLVSQRKMDIELVYLEVHLVNMLLNDLKMTIIKINLIFYARMTPIFPGFTLAKRSKDCNDNYKVDLKEANTLAECAQRCKERNKCYSFEYGIGTNSKKCFGNELTNTFICTKGWETDDYNVYQLQGIILLILQETLVFIDANFSRRCDILPYFRSMSMASNTLERMPGDCK